MAMPCFGKNCYSDIDSGKIKLFFLEYYPGSSQDRITELFCTTACPWWAQGEGILFLLKRVGSFQLRECDGVSIIRDVFPDE